MSQNSQLEDKKKKSKENMRILQMRRNREISCLLHGFHYLENRLTAGDHYDTISAFIKSMRGSDPDAAVYYLGRMLYAGESVTFIARRIMICAAEDVGNADPNALAPIPFSLSYTARIRSVLISSRDNGFNSNTIERDINAPFTSKYGFSVVDAGQGHRQYDECGIYADQCDGGGEKGHGSRGGAGKVPQGTAAPPHR